ncbi:inositol-pentakisphosphate 2-kinase-like isoform X1 [Arctopsyche grandis]|uniref:inositol-pentakisphosphate 2-kinase-like isoform X1 n=1 Tax=Arctopsyche grandis TaxID=121162 RepID=UPI00406D6BA5
MSSCKGDTNPKGLSLDNKTIQYIGEGNCNIVVSIQDSGLILRLRKVNNNIDVDMEYSLSFNELDTLLFELEFHNKVMKLLIGNRFVHPTNLVALDSIEISNLINKINHKRPVSRQHKTLNCKYGLLSVDFTSPHVINVVNYPTLCVEIKCKQGWKPYSLKKYRKCFFCMNQYLKLKNNSINKISGYCPLDLFSGNPYRMYNALMELIENQQNNFNLSVSAEKLFNENVSISKAIGNYFKLCHIDVVDPINILLKIIISSLLWNENHESDDTLYAVNNENNADTLKFCDDSPHILPSGCVLDAILQMQLLEKGNNLEEIEFFSDYEYARDLIDLFEFPTNLPDCFAKLNSLQKYMLACVAKDCSIMISIKPLNDMSLELLNNEIIVRENNCNFVIKIGVIDIDPKPTSKINQHIKRNKDVLENYLKVLINDNIYI